MQLFRVNPSRGGQRVSSFTNALWEHVRRMALGASRSSVVSLILRQTVLLLAVGIGIGVVFALAAARSAGSLLYGSSA